MNSDRFCDGQTEWPDFPPAVIATERYFRRCDENYIFPEIDSAAVELNDLTFRRLRLSPGNVSAVRDDSSGSPKIYCAAVKLNDLTFRRLRWTQENVSAGRDGKYDSTKIDSAAVKLNDLFCRRRSYASNKFAADACGSVQQHITIFRCTDWPPDNFAASSARRLYKARPVDCAVSMQWTSDGVTRFLIFPKTSTMLSMVGSPPSSRNRECRHSSFSSGERWRTAWRHSVEWANRNAIVEWSIWFGHIPGFSTVSARCMARWRKWIRWTVHASRWWVHLCVSSVSCF